MRRGTRTPSSLTGRRPASGSAGTRGHRGPRASSGRQARPGADRATGCRSSAGRSRPPGSARLSAREPGGTGGVDQVDDRHGSRLPSLVGVDLVRHAALIRTIKGRPVEPLARCCHPRRTAPGVCVERVDRSLCRQYGSPTQRSTPAAYVSVYGWRSTKTAFRRSVVLGPTGHRRKMSTRPPEASPVGGGRQRGRRRQGGPDGVRAERAKRVGFRGPPARRTIARRAHRHPPGVSRVADRVADRAASRVTVAVLNVLPPHGCPVHR